MSILEIGANQAMFHLDRIRRDMDRLSNQLATGRKINHSADDPVLWSRIQRGNASVKKLLDINNALNMVAENIRIADKAMETIRRYIGQMKADLDAIIKNYPPYPPGDPERVKYLRSFAALREQIDRMTIPPRDEGARRIMSDPASNPDAGDWEVMINENGDRVVIRSREVHTGPTGLDIPPLPDDATDAEIEAAISSLERAVRTLSERQAGLGGDAASIQRSSVFNEKISAIQTKISEKAGQADVEEAGALAKATGLRYEVAMEAVRSLTGMHEQLLELLE